jgi:hypothetical protein
VSWSEESDEEPDDDPAGAAAPSANGCGVTQTGRCVPAASGAEVSVPAHTGEAGVVVVVATPCARTPCPGTTEAALTNAIANIQRLAVAQVLCFISHLFDWGIAQITHGIDDPDPEQPGMGRTAY